MADTSLARDRRVKIPLYARAGIREVWLVDLIGDRLEVCRDPTKARYSHVRTIGRGESVVPEAFPDLTIAIADLLG